MNPFRSACTVLLSDALQRSRQFKPLSKLNFLSNCTLVLSPALSQTYATVPDGLVTS